MEVIVLAGGLGTRLKSVIHDTPKPMAIVAGKPFLQYVLDWLLSNNITRVIFSGGYKWESIYTEFGEKYGTVDLAYSIETSPLGTGGAIALAISQVQHDKFFIINGDTFFNIDLKEFKDFHCSGNYEISVALKPMRNFSRYGKVDINEHNRITRFYEKVFTKEGVINGGIYITNKSIVPYFPESEIFSFEKDFLETKTGELSFGGFIRDGYFIDIGVPEDYERAQIELIRL